MHGKDDQNYGPHGYGCNCPRTTNERTGDLRTDTHTFAVAIVHNDMLIEILSGLYPGGFKAFLS